MTKASDHLGFLQEPSTKNERASRDFKLRNKVTAFTLHTLPRAVLTCLRKDTKISQCIVTIATALQLDLSSGQNKEKYISSITFGIKALPEGRSAT